MGWDIEDVKLLVPVSAAVKAYFRELKKEIERRKNFEGIGSTPNLTHGPLHNANGSMASGRSVPSLPNSTDEQLLREVHNFPCLSNSKQKSVQLAYVYIK